MRGFGLKFRLFGFPVIIDPSFFFLVAILWLTNLQTPFYALTIAACILVSVMVHEFGHAVVGRFYGMKPSIRMTLLGGLTEWSVEEGKNPSNVQHILITLAGPFAGFLLGGLVLVICLILDLPFQFTLRPASIIDILLLFNFMWGLANLLPLYPLDGGQVLYYSLRTNKSLPADQISAYVSLILGGAVVVWALYYNNFFIAFILVWLLSINFQRLRAVTSPKRQEIIDHARRITLHMNARRYSEGLQTSAELLVAAKEERVRSWATEMVAVFLDLLDNPQTTLDFLKAHRRNLSSSDATRFLRLKAEGDHKEAMAFGSRALYARPSLTLIAVYSSELIRQGNLQEAKDKIFEYRNSPWFGQLAAYAQLQLMREGAFRESIEMGEEALEKESTPEISYNIAAAYARLDNAGAALSRLEDAIRRGFVDVETMANDEDLQSLHDHHGFIDLLSQLQTAVEELKAKAAEAESAEAAGKERDAVALGREGEE